MLSKFMCFLNFRPEEYKKKVSEYVRKYASEEALRQNNDGGVSSSSESSMSDYSEDEAQVLNIKIWGRPGYKAQFGGIG